MKIAVLTGGLSAERDVAISSGTKIARALRQKGHQAVLLDVFLGCEDKNCNPDKLFENNCNLIQSGGIAEEIPDISRIRAMRGDKSPCFLGENVVEICRRADITFFALHGGEGENGKLQATFDILGIKYTGTDYLSAALAMDKGITKALLEKSGVLSAKGGSFKKGQAVDRWELFPCVIKPCCGGSSVGVSIVRNRQQLDKAVNEAFSFEDEIIIEQFIEGREFSVGVLGEQILPPVEIIPKSGFYDYKSKYQAGLTADECPADITEEQDKILRTQAFKAFKALRLRSYARIDFILDSQNNAYCLEANTLPGMTPTSLLPMEAAAVGMDFPSLCHKIVELSLEKYENITDR